MQYVFIMLSLCSTQVLAQDVRVQLDQFRRDFVQCQSDQRFERLQTYYDDNLRFMPEFQKTVMGKKNACLYNQAFARHFDIRNYERHDTEVIDLGERVVEIGFFTANLSPKTRQPITMRGKYLDLWKKSNGKLSLITQAWNYDQSLPWESEFQLDEVPSENVALQAYVPVKDNISFEITAINILMENTISQHDGKIWSLVYSDDGSFLYSRTAPVVGRAALDSFFKEHAAGSVVFEKLAIRNDRIDDLGKYVIGYASHVAILRGDNFSGVNTGKDLAIWRREPNGSLKVFRHIAMYDW
jgi:ketosteroid isomerase-like protein